MINTYKYVQKLSDHDLIFHNIKMCDMEIRGGWYRQLTSLESFVDRLSERWYYSFQKKNKYNYQPTIQRDAVEYTDLYYEGNPIWVWNKTEKYWNSVWDFYDHLGYNHKDKSVKQLDKFILKLEKYK